MTRKEFIQKTGFLCMASLSSSLLLESCVSIHYATHQYTENTKEIQVSLTEFWDVKKNAPRKFVIIRDSKLAFPIYLWKHEQEYLALYMYCTHKGCELNPQNEFLICPCHGSEFDKFGKPQNPPADKDLLRFVTRLDAEHIYIQIDDKV